MSWKITPIFYKGATRLQVTFENIPTLNKKIRSIKGATFSATLQAWHVPDTVETRMQLNFYDESCAAEAAPINANTPESAFVKSTTIAVIKDFDYYLQSKRYRPNTIKSYKDALLSFLKFWNHKEISELNTQDIVVYNN